MSDLFWSLFQRSNVRATDIPWDEAADNVLREWWPNSKIPAKDIGQKMTPPRSKNAVIGRAKRIGLHPRRIKAWGWGSVSPVKPRKPPAPRFNPARLDDLMAQAGLPLLSSEPQNWSPIGVPLLEAKRSHCRAIVESSAFSATAGVVYCGHPIVPRQPFSFCPHHLARYTTPRYSRRRR